jgi:hypothetical protein
MPEETSSVTLDHPNDEALALEVEATKWSCMPEWDEELIFEITAARCPKQA